MKKQKIVFFSTIVIALLIILGIPYVVNAESNEEESTIKLKSNEVEIDEKVYLDLSIPNKESITEGVLWFGGTLDGKDNKSFSTGIYNITSNSPYIMINVMNEDRKPAWGTTREIKMLAISRDNDSEMELYTCENGTLKVEGNKQLTLKNNDEIQLNNLRFDGNRVNVEQNTTIPTTLDFSGDATMVTLGFKSAEGKPYLASAIYTNTSGVKNLNIQKGELPEGNIYYLTDIYFMNNGKMKKHYVTKKSEKVADGVETFEYDYDYSFITHSNEGIKSILNIDTNLENTVFDKNGIHIEGWKLAIARDTKLNVYIDGQTIDEEYIKYSRKYDLISIVQGYGTYEENPQPNFDIDIPIDDLEDGNHSLRIEFITPKLEVLEVIQKNISIDRSIDELKLNEFKINTDKVYLEKVTKNSQLIGKIPFTLDFSGNIDTISVAFTNENGKIFGPITIYSNYSIYIETDKREIDIYENSGIDIGPKYYLTDIFFMKNGHKNIVKHYVTKKSRNKANGKDILNLEYDEPFEFAEKKSILNIDTVLNNARFDRDGIKINGWKLATEANTKLRVYIDGKSINGTEINYSRKYDLISIVKGYGTYVENPTPNFEIKIPTTDFSEGEHKLKIDFVNSNGDILKSVENNINIDKVFFRNHIETIFDRTTITNEVHPLSGWLMTNSKVQKIRLMLDGVYQENTFTRTQRPDVIRYFNYSYEDKNATPGFATNIDFSKLSLGLHQIAIRVFDENDNKIGEEVLYVWLKQKEEEKPFFQTHVESIYDRTSISKEVHSLSGWLMTNSKEQNIRLMIDGEYQNNKFTRTKRPDVNRYFNNIYEERNLTPGFSTNIDFSKLSSGLHQIAIRVFNEKNNKIGELVLYVFVY